MSSYDQQLLDEAPRATRAQLQEGYNVDLLEEPRPPRRAPSARKPPPSQTPPVSVPLKTVVPETSSGEKLSSPPTASKSSRSFWRSRNGVITIVVIILVLIGAVVGGAVGGTANKNKKPHKTGTSHANPSSPSPSRVSSTTETAQGIGSVSTKGVSTANSPEVTQKGQNSGGQLVGH